MPIVEALLAFLLNRGRQKALNFNLLYASPRPKNRRARHFIGGRRQKISRRVAKSEIICKKGPALANALKNVIIRVWRSSRASFVERRLFVRTSKTFPYKFNPAVNANVCELRNRKRPNSLARTEFRFVAIRACRRFFLRAGGGVERLCRNESNDSRTILCFGERRPVDADGKFAERDSSPLRYCRRL